MSKKKHNVRDGSAWRALPAERRAAALKALMTGDNIVPAMRAKVADMVIRAAETPRRNAQGPRERGIQTREAIRAVVSPGPDIKQQYEQYKKLPGVFHLVNYRRFKEVRLEILNDK